MLEKHCVSLEVAKRMVEVGWKKNTQFGWVEILGIGNISNTHLIYYKNESAEEIAKEVGGSVLANVVKGIYSAPLATEILEELPEKVIQFSECCKDPIDNIQYFSLPDALGKLWIYLQEQKQKG